MHTRNSVVVAAVAGFVVTSQAVAGHITIRGAANVGHKPEYMEISVKIESQCYETFEQLAKVTNGASKAIQDVMQSHMNMDEGSKDQIIALPGEFKRGDVTKYIDGRNTTLCKKGWQGENTLILKLADQAQWPQLQVDMLEVSDQYSVMEVGAATTNLTIMQPKPQLCPETMARMKMEADHNAILDATKKFHAVKTQCALGHCQIEQFSAIGSHVPMMAYSRAERAPVSSEESFQPEYDLIYVRAAWDVQWSFSEQSNGMGALRDRG